MANFCKQCSIEHFGEDFEDHKGRCEAGQILIGTCEGCGRTVMDHTGRCINMDCLRKHGESKEFTVAESIITTEVDDKPVRIRMNPLKVKR